MCIRDSSNRGDAPSSPGPNHAPSGVSAKYSLLCSSDAASVEPLVGVRLSCLSSGSTPRSPLAGQTAEALKHCRGGGARVRCRDKACPRSRHHD
eukprot:3555230-Prymnesium_polylepis.1